MKTLSFSLNRVLRLSSTSAGSQSVLRSTELLHSLLIGSLLWLMLQVALIVPLFSQRKLVSFAMCGGGILLLWGSFAFLRNGEMKRASIVFLATLWAGTLVCSCLSGGIESVFLVLHAAIPIVAGPLLGLRAALISLGASISVALLMALGAVAGIQLPRYFPMPPVPSWMVVLLALILGTLPVIHILRALHDALLDAKQQALRFSHDAIHDPLTGLPNRSLFLDRLNHCLSVERRGQRSHSAVLLIDIDRFKVFNDTMGFSAGDRLLTLVGQRLAAAMRPGDTLSRVGGDEFAVLLEQMADPSTAPVLAEGIGQTLDAPFEVDEHKVFVTASVGVVIGSQGHQRAEDVLNDAESAMKRAWNIGGARQVIFSEQMRISLLNSGQLERDLHLACERDEFVFGFEPMVSLKTGSVNGYEALLRWQHPTRGLLYPADFLALAGETDLIAKIDRMVVSKACQCLARWSESDVSLSVNVSGRTIREDGFVEHVSACLAENGLRARKLKLEITEQVLVEAVQCIAVLEQLNMLGVQLVLDDFGTGYSSLSYLTRFPISHLKIDRGFIRGLDSGDRSMVVVRAIVGLAQGLGMTVTAEGVETKHQMELVRDLGCHYAQGEFVGRGLKASDVEQRLAGAAAAGQRHGTMNA
jgi:diguanylate cyclase (GGDEF)-like protein